MSAPALSWLSHLSPVSSLHRHGHWARLLRLPDIQFCPFSQRLVINSCDRFHWLKENTCQSSTCHSGGACVTESVSVLPDPATYGILNSELKNCQRTAAVLGELAAQWQQMMETLHRVEQETVSC